jgi:putative ABC transport system permease protein
VAIAEVVTAIIGMPSSIVLWVAFAGLTVAQVSAWLSHPARWAAKLDPIVALWFEM